MQSTLGLGCPAVQERCVLVLTLILQRKHLGNICGLTVFTAHLPLPNSSDSTEIKQMMLHFANYKQQKPVGLSEELESNQHWDLERS